MCCPASWFCDTVAATFVRAVGYEKTWLANYPSVYYLSSYMIVRSAFMEFGHTVGISVKAQEVSIQWRPMLLRSVTQILFPQ
jgi:hypothetical protein